MQYLILSSDFSYRLTQSRSFGEYQGGACLSGACDSLSRSYDFSLPPTIKAISSPNLPPHTLQPLKPHRHPFQSSQLVVDTSVPQVKPHTCGASRKSDNLLTSTTHDLATTPRSALHLPLRLALRKQRQQNESLTPALDYAYGL
jgi:hypothetical protein